VRTRPPTAEPSSAGAAADRAERLLAVSEPLGVPLPAYGGRSLPNVASSVLRALGHEPPATALPPLEASVDPFAGRRAEGPVVLFVVDGLGYLRLARSAGRADGARAARWLAHSTPLTSVFPTTTTVALASLSTATSPSRHGLVGYRQYLPAFGAVVDMLRQSPNGVSGDDALVGPNWSPSMILGTPTIFRERIRDAVAVSRDRFEGRGFTRLLYDGAGYAPYSGYADFAATLSSVLTGASAPSLVLAYWDELDTTSHLQGPASAAIDLDLDRLVELLGFVARQIGPSAARRTTVLLTADHGQVPLVPSVQTAVDADPELMALLARPPTGDRRVGLLKARSGMVDRLERAIRARLGEKCRTFRSEEAVRHGLFGPPPYHPELIERIGDLVVLVPSPGGITYTPPGRSAMRRSLLGGHGGLEADEFLVPLVAGPLAELGPGAPG
jgi:Type I phosphodiesterase / nucleotide pyrophosphatase